MALLSAGQAAGRVSGSFTTNLNTLAGVTAILAAASNVNGAVLRSATILNGSLHVGTTAPTTQADRQCLLLINGASTYEKLVRDIFIPPGQGLWFFGAAGGQFLTGYDIL